MPRHQVSCNVCGETAPSRCVRRLNGDFGRNQKEILNPPILRDLENGDRRLVVCQDPDSDWYTVHTTDVDAPKRRNRYLSSRQIEDMGDRLDGWYGPD